jgi:UV damage endonuclease UvdE
MSEYFNNTSRSWRISQCCQFFDPKLVKIYNVGTVTKTTALGPNGKQKVQEKALANLDKLYKTLADYFAKQPVNLRSFRISTTLLPVFTVEQAKPWYQEIDDKLQQKLRRIGDIAKSNEIRLSMHPGQYTVLASNNPEVVKNSIEDIEYHAMIGKYMGLEAKDFVVNIHLQGVYKGTREEGINRFASHFSYLSDYAQQCLAVENEDKHKSGYDITHVLDLCSKIPTRATFDIHHYDCWGKKERPYPSTNLAEFKQATSTWKTSRPLFHVSHTRQADGIDVPKALEHSDVLHDLDRLACMTPMLEYADFDIEAKHKEIAVNHAYAFFKQEEIYAGEPLQAKQQGDTK